MVIEQTSPEHAPVCLAFDASKTIQSIFPTFINKATSGYDMQNAIRCMTAEAILAAKVRNSSLDGRCPVTLVPILRGALPMYVAALDHFK